MRCRSSRQRPRRPPMTSRRIRRGAPAPCISPGARRRRRAEILFWVVPTLSPHVVPAKAGTHNHRPWLFTQGVNHTALSTDSAVWLPDRRSLCSLVRDEVDRSDFKQPIRLPHHCERSEAIQLATQRKKKWIASSLTLLAMTSLIETCIHVLAAQTRPRRCVNHPRKEQAQEIPGARCARGRVCIGRIHTRWQPQVRRVQPAFPARWFYGLFSYSPVTGHCHRRSRVNPATLTPASGRQDHTTSASVRSSSDTACVQRIPPQRP